MYFNRYVLINITLTNACFIFSIILIGVQRLISSLISKSLFYTPNNFSRCTTDKAFFLLNVSFIPLTILVGVQLLSSLRCGFIGFIPLTILVGVQLANSDAGLQLSFIPLTILVGVQPY